MLKRVYWFAAAMLLLCISVCAAEDTVYLDGTGTTDGVYTDLYSAVAALPNGGTVIVSGDTTVGTASAGVTLPAVDGKVTVTAENGAVLTLMRSLLLSSETEFRNLTICNASADRGNIIACGNPLIMGEGVVTTTTADRYPTIIGGNDSKTCAGSHVTICSGTWFLVYGGNYSGNFVGDSVVDITGGTILSVLTGGNRTGNFTGNATINIGGNALIERNQDSENGEYIGVIGGTMGLKSETTARAFNGNIAINISGNAECAATIFGSSRYSNVTTAGDITITVSENAKLTRHIYACGNYGNVQTGEDGVKIILKDSASIGTNSYVVAGAYTGDVTGDLAVEIRDDASVGGAVYAGCQTGDVNGNTSAALYGGSVSSTFSSGSRSGTVSGTQTILLKEGTVGGAVKGDATIDLDAGASVTIASCSGEITTRVPDGYEIVTDGNTYSVRAISTEPAPTVVYVDGGAIAGGDGSTPETAVQTLAEAALLLRDGGTIVVSGDVAVDTAQTLLSDGDLVITSVYGGVDYTDTAAVRVGADILLGAPTTFCDIVLDKVLDGNLFIVANGFPLVIGENVFCRNNLATNYISLVGGCKDGEFTGNTDITVTSGYFRNIFGANYMGDFSGNTSITFTGGYVDHMITGGSYRGNFVGEAHLHIGGDAVVVYKSDAPGVIGSIHGAGTDTYTFDGNIYITLDGSCRINNNVLGAARYGNVTTTGNVEITVGEDALLYRNLYAGGYAGVLNGNTKVLMQSGEVGVNLTGGSRGGTVNGDTYVEINGGRVNYYKTNYFAGYSEAAGTYNVYGGGYVGSSVNGNTTVVVNGGDIYGNVYGGADADGGTVSGDSTVTVRGGSIWCGVSMDDTVAGAKTLTVDLSDGGNLALGLPAEVTELVGGGSLTLFPEAQITAKKFSGNVALSINGIPQAKAYITAVETDNASVTYTAQENEVFAETVGEGATEYGVTSAGYYATTAVTILHHANAQVTLRAGLATSGDTITAVSVEDGKTVYDLAPGMYNYVVRHAASDYKRKYIYVTGKEETLSEDQLLYAPQNGAGFEAKDFAENTEKIIETYYSTEDLVGFTVPDTPFFTNDRSGTRRFTSNAEMLSFIENKVSACDYAYTYDLFTSPGGTTVPAVLFTKDDIPANATLSQAAEIVSAIKGRDIMMVTAIIHGNEPSAGEGALALISELCGAYGDTLLTGNVGAVIILPRLNPDGCAAFARETPTAVRTADLNRDYAMLTSAEITGVAKAYGLFMPTFFIDCHEAWLRPRYGQSYTLTDVYDVGLVGSGAIGTPFVDGEAVIRGDYASRGMRSMELVTEAMEKIEQTGLRPYYYQEPMTFPANNTAYGEIGGAYTFLVEVSGISGGDAFFARRVFSQVTAVKAIFALAAESDGLYAREVQAAREAVAYSAQIYDENTPVVLQHAYSRHDASARLWNNPLVGADGTTRKAANITKYYLQDIAVKYRARPTAYVVPADASGITQVLGVLDKQGIAYHLLDAGTTLTLAQYSGTASAATLGIPTEVTFANGAYIVPVDFYKANLTALLFEPESIDSGSNLGTFVQAGYLTAEEIYRSTENYIAAKLGLKGTYLQLAIPEGKTLAGAVVDGVDHAADAIGTEGTNAYVPAADSDYYKATLTFTDGTSETYTVGKMPGDFSGNDNLDVADVLLWVRAYLTAAAEPDMDITGDGKVNLLDALHLLKRIAA